MCRSRLLDLVSNIGFSRGNVNVVDAFTSYLLLLTLSQLARRGRTVILSIHAPRSDAFPLFDRISLLSKGQVVYSGHRRDCLGWFASLEHNLVAGVNPLGTLLFEKTS
jgi:ABC-type multidrug transport system ATPase subunit